MSEGPVHWFAVRAAGSMLCALLVLPATTARANDADGHEFHRHHLGMTLGAGSRDHEGSWEHGFVGGLDYEFRFSKWLGVGVFAEGAAGDLRDVVTGGLLFVHPWKGLLLVAGPAAEITSHETEYATRVGAAYQFPVGDRFTIAPTFNVDFVQGDPTYIYGITLGVGF